MIQMNLYVKEKQAQKQKLTHIGSKLVVTKGKREGVRDKLGLWD